MGLVHEWRCYRLERGAANSTDGYCRGCNQVSPASSCIQKKDRRPNSLHPGTDLSEGQGLGLGLGFRDLDGERVASILGTGVTTEPE